MRCQGTWKLINHDPLSDSPLPCPLPLLLPPHYTGPTGDLALLYESWWKTRRSIIWTIAPDRRGEEKKVLFDR